MLWCHEIWTSRVQVSTPPEHFPQLSRHQQTQETTRSFQGGHRDLPACHHRFSCLKNNYCDVTCMLWRQKRRKGAATLGEFVNNFLSRDTRPLQLYTSQSVTASQQKLTESHTMVVIYTRTVDQIKTFSVWVPGTGSQCQNKSRYV